MSIDYGKTAPEPRFFLLFGEEGPWSEVTKNAYLAAQAANGIKAATPMDHFDVGTLQGTLTEDGSRPKDVKKVVVANPMIRRASEAPDASYRLIFPEGSYHAASTDEDDRRVTVVLTPEQYAGLCKAQGPILLDRWATNLEQQDTSGSRIKGAALGALIDMLRSVAADMRADRPTKAPGLKGLKDIFKS